MADIILPQIIVDMEPVTWGSKIDRERRNEFSNKLLEAIREQLPNYNLSMLRAVLAEGFVSIKLDFYLSKKHFDRAAKNEHKNIDNLCKIPIDSIYENIVGDIKKDWLVNEIIARKHQSDLKQYVVVEIARSA
ncbi:MAG: hypothetical protein QXJ74_11105 [Nitrososphaera sp.]|uniref:hypothetical protein n=1 Tax=Nitrososphaera sp. TaxID=1971748 RepID=UPI0017EEEC9D|nr:hypothetical protein [Nitrososphaera sp.]NWG37086.1 RusA family crossover junction endodeoxyribonuclease [Nitrososphaera sp.]